MPWWWTGWWLWDVSLDWRNCGLGLSWLVRADGEEETYIRLNLLVVTVLLCIVSETRDWVLRAKKPTP
mgnify:CR=1 FL=1|jgi:hypothetical protein